MFFGGYLHQDWREEYSTVELALRAFIAEYPEKVQPTMEEIKQVLKDEKFRSDPIRFLQMLDCYYNPAFENRTPSEWLLEIDQRFRELVAAARPSAPKNT